MHVVTEGFQAPGVTVYVCACVRACMHMACVCVPMYEFFTPLLHACVHVYANVCILTCTFFFSSEKLGCLFLMQTLCKQDMSGAAVAFLWKPAPLTDTG